MFRPDSNRDRTDYSGILMPPDGYRLDRAVGTTYSLDLEALTAVAICLGLSEETDSKLMQNPIGMLNALQKVSGIMDFYVPAANTKNSLYAGIFSDAKNIFQSSGLRKCRKY